MLSLKSIRLSVPEFGRLQFHIDRQPYDLLFRFLGVKGVQVQISTFGPLFKGTFLAGKTCGGASKDVTSGRDEEKKKKLFAQTTHVVVVIWGR